MDDLISGLKWLGEFWAVAAAIAVGAAGWIRYGRRHGQRLIRSLALSDRLHEQFGENTALALSTAIHEACVEGAIREVRVILLEQSIGAKVFICDANTGECKYANSELAEFFGLDASDFIGHGWLRAVDRSEKLEVHEHWQACVSQHLPYEYDYTVHNQRTGEQTRCRARAYPAKLKNGELTLYVGTVEPIKNE